MRSYSDNLFQLLKKKEIKAGIKDGTQMEGEATLRRPASTSPILTWVTLMKTTERQ